MKSKPVDATAGRVLRKLRTEAGLTQHEIGQRIGVSYQQIQKYETGANRMSISALFSISAALQMRAAEFVLQIENELRENAVSRIQTDPV